MAFLPTSVVADTLEQPATDAATHACGGYVDSNCYWYGRYGQQFDCIVFVDADPSTPPNYRNLFSSYCVFV